MIVLCQLLLPLGGSAFTRASGAEVLCRDGKPCLWKGISVGNWLNMEGYMFLLQNATSQSMILQVIDQLVGQTKRKEFHQNFIANYFREEDMRFIARTGANLVRVPFNYQLFLGREGFDIIDRLLVWAKRYSLDLVIDLHAAPGGQTGANIDDSGGYPFLYQDSESVNLTIKIWRQIADRYKNEQYVAGYQLLNEPLSFDYAGLKSYLQPLYKKIVAAIREVDKNHMIILDGALYASDFSVFGKPFDSNLMYSFHKYWTEPVFQQIASYLAFRDKYSVPIWMGESGQNSDSWIQKFVTLLNQHKVPWSFWPYKKMNSSSCFVSIVPPPNYSVLTQYADGDRSSVDAKTKRRPGNALSAQVLGQVVEAVGLSSCRVNSGYIRALGLSAVQDEHQQ